MPRAKRMTSRKISNREKIGLGLLLTVAIGYAYVQYLVLPMRDRLNGVQSEIASIQVDVDRVRNYRSLNENLEGQIMEEGMDLDEAFRRHFTKLNQEDVIMLMNEKINLTGIESSGLNFDRPSMDLVADQELERNSFEISFRGGYQTLSSFLDEIEDYEKKIIVDRINLSREEGGILSGTLFMNMYSIESIVEDAMTLFPWDQDMDYIAVNPFDPFASYIQQEIIGDDSSSGDRDDDRRPGDTTPGTSPGSTTPGTSPDWTTPGTTPGTTTPGTSPGGTKPGTSPGGTTPGTTPGESSPGTTPGTTTPGTPDPEEPVEKGTLIEGFADRSSFFVVGSPRDDVRVSIEASKDKTSESQSLELDYNFLKERRVSTASLGFVSDLIISKEYSKLQLDVKPLLRNQHKLGLVIRDSRGRLYDLTISENLDWNNWKSLEVDMPEDMLYPIRVQRFYVESRDFDKILIGNILIDSLRGID